MASLIIIFIFLLCARAYVVALIDILVSTFESTNTKLLWIIIVLFAPVIGSFIYFAIGMGQKVSTKRYTPYKVVIH